MCITWKCHGLGNSGAVLAFKKDVKLKDPTLMFFSEAKLKSLELDKLRPQMGFTGGFYVDC